MKWPRRLGPMAIENSGGPPETGHRPDVGWCMRVALWSGWIGHVNHNCSVPIPLLTLRSGPGGVNFQRLESDDVCQDISHFDFIRQLDSAPLLWNSSSGYRHHGAGATDADGLLQMIISISRDPLLRPTTRPAFCSLISGLTQELHSDLYNPLLRPFFPLLPHALART